MHNKHYLLIQATDTDEVDYVITNKLDNYGNEDNWYEVNKVYNLAENKEGLQDILDYLTKQFSYENIQTKKNEIEYLLDKATDSNRHIYWQLSEVYKELYELIPNQEVKVTVDNLVDVESYFGYTYDKEGFTNLVYTNEEVSLNELYLVEIDMHS